MEKNDTNPSEGSKKNLPSTNEAAGTKKETTKAEPSKTSEEVKEVLAKEDAGKEQEVERNKTPPGIDQEHGMVRDEAEKALENICTNMDLRKVLQALLNLPFESVVRVKRQVVLSMDSLLRRIGSQLPFFPDKDKLLSHLVVFSKDQDEEVQRLATHCIDFIKENRLGHLLGK